MITVRRTIWLGCAAAAVVLLGSLAISTADAQVPPDIQLSVPEAMPASQFMSPGHEVPGAPPAAMMEPGPQRIPLTGHYVGDVRQQILSAGAPAVPSPASPTYPLAEPQQLRAPIARRLPPVAARRLISQPAVLTAVPPQSTAIVQAGASQAGGNATPVTPSVVPAFYTTVSPVHGLASGELAQAIAELESRTTGPATCPEEAAQHASLRLLYLVAGRRSDALRPIVGLSTADREAWTQQIQALDSRLGAASTTNKAGAQLVASAARLRDAMELLNETAALQVSQLHFCSEVTSYGVFTEIDQQQLRPGRPVLLYAEIENFKSTQTPRGQHTVLRASYRIVDAQGRTIEEKPLGVVEEHCRNRRRDYFVCYQLTLPGKLTPGKYSLHLNVDDLEGAKSAAAPREFAIE